MILTITMNPSIDMAYTLENFNLDQVNRTSHINKTAGGKGLNVSRVLNLLGQDITASGIIGGHFGAFIEEGLDKDGINHDFTHIDQESRNSIAILHDNGKQTEILEEGPVISASDKKAFLANYKDLLSKSTLVTISGSLPRGLGDDFYIEMLELADQQNVRVILDTSGKSLELAIKNKIKPYLIKPNEFELGQLIGEKIDKNDLPSLKTHLQSPELNGIEWIVVSLGSKGALAKHNEKFYYAKIPKITVVNPVGSGDSTLAGLADAINQNLSDVDVLKTGMTTGMLNTMEAKTGFINPKLFDEYFQKVQVSEY